MVTEAFLKGDNTQRGLGAGAVKKSNEEWKFWIVMIIVFNTTGFAAVIFVLFKTYKHFKPLHAKEVHTNRFLAEYYETLVKRIEKRIFEVEERVEFGEKKNLKTS